MKSVLRILVALILVLSLTTEVRASTTVDNCFLFKNKGHLEFNSKVINADGAFTIEFWTNQLWSIPYVTEIISQGSQPNAVYIGPTAEGIYRAGDGWLSTGIQAKLNEWTHIALTRSASGVGRFFINGSLAATNPNYATANGTWNTRLGAQFGSWAGEEYAGCIDELRIWNYERSLTDVASSTAKNSITNGIGLLYWSFDSRQINHISSELPFASTLNYQTFGSPSFTRVTESGFELGSTPRERPKLINYPVCGDAETAPCISSVTLISKEGVRIEAVPVEPRVDRYNFASLSSDPVPIYRWRTPGIIHENGGDLIDVDVYRFPLGADYCWARYSCANDVDEIVIYLYGATRGKTGKKIDFPDLPSDKVCGDTTQPQECFRNWGLNKEYRYEVALKIEKGFDFSHSNGEARDGSLSVRELDSGEKKLTFSGYPVSFSSVVESTLRPAPSRDKADSTFDYIGVYAHSARSGQSQWLASCDYGRGLSMWYSGRLQSMPMWLFDESALTLKVSSTHLRADGTKNLGSFNIEMPIRTAQCLWGVDLSKATRAVVSVLSSGSDAADVMTTASKVADGFYKISAAGFHFSTPTIKVKVEQVVAPASDTSSVKVPVKKQSDPTKLQTIKCFKGKEVKLFNRKSGKCPKGYSIKRTKSAQSQ